MRRVLVMRFSALGDVVLSTTVLAALRTRYPEAEIWWLTKRQWADLFREDARIDELVLLEPGESVVSLARRLRDTPFDLVIDAHASLRSRSLCALLPPTPTRRLAKDSLARWWHLHGGPITSGLDRQLVDRYQELVEPESPAARPVVRPTRGATERSEEELGASVPWLAMAPGARHHAKRWPLEHFVELSRRVARSSGARILLVGGPDERGDLDAMASQLGPLARVWDPDGTLELAAAALAHCSALVGNDSGLLHLAEAVGTPVVAVFGPTVRAWGYAPLASTSRVVEQDLPCRPCSKMGEKPCRLAEAICLTRTTPDAVFSALEETWNNVPTARP